MDVQTIAGLGLGVLVLLVVYKKRRSPYVLPPGPYGLPILGNVLQMLNPEGVSSVFKEWSIKYGSVFIIKLGYWQVVVLNKWDVIREALVQRQNDFAGRPKVASFRAMTPGGVDLFMNDYGPMWKMHRRLATTAIRNYALGEHLEKLVRQNLELMFEKLDKAVTPIDMREHFALLAFNMGFSMCYGKTLEYDSPEFSRFNNVTKEFLEIFGNGLPEDFFPFLRHFPSTQRTKLFEFSEEYLSLSRNAYFEAKNSLIKDCPRCLTDHLVLAQMRAMEENQPYVEQLTDVHLYMTLTDMIAAGNDTITYTLYWFVLHMSQHLDIQERMQQEIDSVCGSSEPTIATKKHLKYTEAVIYESIRIEGTTPLGLPHATMCDTKVGGYDIPKGTWVLANLNALHHDPEYFTEPETFKPERFLDSSGTPYRPESYIPFSAGRRVCLGEVLAKNELMLIVPRIFQKYRFLPTGDGIQGYSMESGILNLPKPFKVIVQAR